MARFKLQQNGVLDTTSGAHIPNDPANRHWQDYQDWLAGTGDYDGDGAQTPDPEFTLQELKDKKKVEINAWREEALGALTVDHGGNTYDADKLARENLTSTLTAIQAGVSVPDPIDWRDASDVTRSLSHTDLNTICGLMFAAVDAAYNHSWDLKGDVDAAADESAVDAIVW